MSFSADSALGPDRRYGAVRRLQRGFGGCWGYHLRVSVVFVFFRLRAQDDGPKACSISLWHWIQCIREPSRPHRTHELGRVPKSRPFHFPCGPCCCFPPSRPPMMTSFCYCSIALMRKPLERRQKRKRKERRSGCVFLFWGGTLNNGGVLVGPFQSRANRGPSKQDNPKSGRICSSKWLTCGPRVLTFFGEVSSHGQPLRKAGADQV